MNERDRALLFAINCVCIFVNLGIALWALTWSNRQIGRWVCAGNLVAAGINGLAVVTRIAAEMARP